MTVAERQLRPEASDPMGEMSTSITFAVHGPPNILRVGFLKKKPAGNIILASLTQILLRNAHVRHILDFFFPRLSYHRIGHRPHFAAVEYGGIYSFCRYVH